MRKLKQTLNLTDKGWQDLKGAIAACVISNLCLLLPFMIILQIITALIDPLMTGQPLNTGRLWVCLGGGVAAALLYFFAYKHEYKKTYTTAYVESETIRLQVAERIRLLPLSFFNQKDLSELTTHMMADCTQIEHAMSHVVPSLIATIITSTLTCAMLAFFDWRMALALFAALPLAFGIILISKRLQKKLGERHVQAKLNVSGQVQEYLDGIKVVKAFGLSGSKSKALEKSLRTMMWEAVKFEGVIGTFVTLGQMFLQVGIGLVVLVGVSLLTAGSLSVLMLLTFLLISAKIYSPLIIVMTLLPELFYLLVSARRMHALRTEPVMTGEADLAPTSCDIRLNNVTFAYHQDDVIKDMTLEIKQNTVTALVGPSGSGKSTVSRLIARFWDVQQGEILLGDTPLRRLDPEKLMSMMSFVFQDVVLFNDTVMNNLRIGKNGASDEEVYAAAKQARCDEFIRQMPDGYHTLIGENGNTLSGGERQRISIARALLKNAPIVLLDEATASLDPENEAQIQAALSELVKGRTVLVIAHRLRTILDADNIAVLQDGRLVEQGTSDELIARDGLFAHMLRIQQQSLGWTASQRSAHQ